MQIVVELVAEVRMLELAAAVKRYLKVIKQLYSC